MEAKPKAFSIYATVAGSSISITGSEVNVYTVSRWEFGIDHYLLNGLDSGYARKHAATLMNFPRLRSFLANYVPWEKTTCAFDVDVLNRMVWRTPRNIIEEFRKEMLDADYAELSRRINADYREEKTRQSSMGDLKVPFSLHDRMPVVGLTRAWLGPPEPLDDFALSAGFALMAAATVNRWDQLNKLDTYPWWESIENIKKYEDGSK